MHFSNAKIFNDTIILPITFLVIVQSLPKHFENRNAIRSTWGNDINSIHEKLIGVPVLGQIIFQVGLDPNDEALNRQIYNESYHYGDILCKNISNSIKSNSFINCMIMNIHSARFC